MDNNFRQININGALVALYKIESLKAVSICVKIKAGSCYEEGENWGKAHFLEHMLFQGTEQFVDVAAMETYKEENGIYTNASTGGQVLSLMMRMPNESLEKGVTLMNEMLFKARMPEEKLNKERKVILQEYDDNWSKPNVRFLKKVNEQYFGKGQRYTRDGLGNKDCINSVTRQELIDYQKKMFVPANMVIAVVGNIDFEEVEKYLKDILVQQGNMVEDNFSKVLPQTEPLVHIEPGMSTTTVDVGWTIRGMNEVTLVERLAMDIGCYLLGRSTRSILFNRVREELGLAYSIVAAFGCFQVAGWFTIRSSVKRENLEETLREIDKAIKQFISEPIDNDLFFRAKKYLIMHEKMSYESTMGIATDFSKQLFWEKRVILSEEYEEILNKITEDQVRGILAREIGNRKPTVSVMRSE